jgi:type I site-specific restriction endonuclease
MSDGHHTPERRARDLIDRQLVDAGWLIQNVDQLNLYAGVGVALREVQTMGGPADYMLFVEGKALGVVEAKKVGTPLSAVAEQSERYGKARDFIPQRWADPLPFTYEEIVARDKANLDIFWLKDDSLEDSENLPPPPNSPPKSSPASKPPWRNSGRWKKRYLKEKANGRTYMG